MAATGPSRQFAGSQQFRPFGVKRTFSKPCLQNRVYEYAAQDVFYFHVVEGKEIVAKETYGKRVWEHITIHRSDLDRAIVKLHETSLEAL